MIYNYKRILCILGIHEWINNGQIEEPYGLFYPCNLEEWNWVMIRKCETCKREQSGLSIEGAHTYSAIMNIKNRLSGQVIRWRN